MLALSPVIEEALRLVRATVPAHIEIEASLDDAPLHVLADGTQIHQIVVNLATNAAHAIGNQEGRIAVRTAQVALEGAGAEAAGVSPGSYVQLEVADDGSGMRPDVLARISPRSHHQAGRPGHGPRPVRGARARQEPGRGDSRRQ